MSLSCQALILLYLCRSLLSLQVHYSATDSHAQSFESHGTGDRTHVRVVALGERTVNDGRVGAGGHVKTAETVRPAASHHWASSCRRRCDHYWTSSRLAETVRPTAAHHWASSCRHRCDQYWASSRLRHHPRVVVAVVATGLLCVFAIILASSSLLVSSPR